MKKQNITNVPSNQRPYILYTPFHDDDIQNVWLDMHGLGERGTNLDKLESAGLPKMLKLNPDFEVKNTAIICPQIPSNRVWNQETNTLRNIWKSLYPDIKAIVGGLSDGGGGALLYHYRYPEDVKAVIDLSGYASVNNAKLVVWASLPSYTTFGLLPHNNNQIVKTKVIPYLNDHRVNGTVTYLYEDLAHNTWDRAYNIDHFNNLFQWVDALNKGIFEKVKTYEDGRRDMKQEIIQAINNIY